MDTDGYAGKKRVYREQQITRIGCWGHARRKFVEACKAAPAKKKAQKVSKVDVVIGKVHKLYVIEKKIARHTLQEKTEQRQKLAQPILNDLKAWLETNSRRVLKES